MDERGEHKNLRDLDCQSIIPYVYRRTELYCSSLPCLSLSFHPPLVKSCLFSPFIAPSWVVTMRHGAQQVAPRWLKPYTTSRTLVVANDVLHNVSSMESSCLLTLLY
jgi:hypothetical protein